MKWIAKGPSSSVLKYHSYLINGVTFYTKERDEVRAVQNSGVSLVAKTMQRASVKDKNPVVSDMVFYGIIEEIWEVDYNVFRVPMFKCQWVDSRGVKVDDLGFTLVNFNRIGYKHDSFILANQAKQVFYVKDSLDSQWSVVLATPTREYFEYSRASEFEDTVLHHPSFSKEMPINDDDTMDDNEPEHVRTDCDGTWIENGNT